MAQKTGLCCRYLVADSLAKFCSVFNIL